MRVAIFAEVDANFAEGPAIWLVGVGKALATQRGWSVTVLLRTRMTRGEMLSPLLGIDNVAVVDPFALGWTDESERPQLSVRRAVEFMERLDGERRFDALMLRGASVCRVATARAALRGRLAYYITDVPQPPVRLNFFQRLRLRRIISGASLLLCQTPELGDHLREELRLGDRIRTALLPPMVADSAFRDGPTPPAEGVPLRLVYTGKFAPAWRSVEMCALPEALARENIDSTLDVAGDKFLTRPDESFPDRMRAALESSRGVTWHGGLTQTAAQQLAATCHVGLSWRTAELDQSLELSTKLLEYGALGLPVMCNPTEMHRRLLGADYPLFVSEAGDFPRAARAALVPETWRAAAKAARALAERHRAAKIGADLARAMSEAFA
jgi:hypothetical protein